MPFNESLKSNLPNLIHLQMLDVSEVKLERIRGKYSHCGYLKNLWDEENHWDIVIPRYKLFQKNREGKGWRCLAEREGYSLVRLRM